MCGICGIVGNAASNNSVRVKQMMHRMLHRGPDGKGLWHSDKKEVTLGHVRLAIQDTSDAGAQPMHHAAGLHYVINGEIYNYPQLRNQLSSSARFDSRCDSEIIKHGWMKKGAKFINELNGMFALAIFDERNGTVTLARDRLGIKPLYYTIYKEQLLFASEIKALFGAIDSSEWEINRQGLTEYMTYQTALGENTLFSNIYQVPPGHTITFDISCPANMKKIAYWTPQLKEDESFSFGSALDNFKNIFHQSVKRHLLSDVDVASYLSSGFDSSSVFAEASSIYNKTSNTPLTAYTGRFDQGNDWYDETGPAGELVKSLEGRHQKIDINAKSFIEDFDAVIDSLDEPRMGMGAFSQYMVAKAVSFDFKVILTGHGGDELFSGYPVFSYAKNGLFGIKKLSELPHYAYFVLSDIQSSYKNEQGYGLPVLWSVEEQKKLLGLRDSNLTPWSELEKWLAKEDDNSNRIFNTYINAYLPGLLMVEDKVSMAHSIESRTPFLDNKIVDLSLSIPPSIKLKDGQLKSIIKTYAKNRLPNSYFSQPKRGFPTPLRHWLRGDLADFVSQRLIRTNNYLSRIFDENELECILQKYQCSWRRHVRPLDEIQSHKIWQLLSIESWIRTWSEKYGVELR